MSLTASWKVIMKINIKFMLDLNVRKLLLTGIAVWMEGESFSYWGLWLIKLALKNAVSCLVWCIICVLFQELAASVSLFSSPSCSVGLWNWIKFGDNFLVANGKQKAEMLMCCLREMWEILFIKVGFPRCQNIVWKGCEIPQCKELAVLCILQIHL